MDHVLYFLEVSLTVPVQFRWLRGHEPGCAQTAIVQESLQMDVGARNFHVCYRCHYAPAAGAWQNLYEHSCVQLFTFYTMLKELYTLMTAAVPIGTDAWGILIPNMKFYQRASAILEEFEDALLQLTVAKAKGTPEVGMAIFTKLGISAEDAERIYAALEIRSTESIARVSKKWARRK